MKILHVLDHSLPVQSGYSFRGAAILNEQRRLGWQTVQLTGPKHGPAGGEVESAAGIEYLRTRPLGPLVAHFAVLDQMEVVRRLRQRLREVLAREQPDLIHAHSPCLNGLAALHLGSPVVYEMRSSWEDAAVSSGATAEGSLRYVASRWLETQVLRRADGVTTICEGLRAEVVARGVAAANVVVVPNAVDDREFVARPTPASAVRKKLGVEGCTVLGFVGSYFAWEGLSLLVDALPAILAHRPEIRLLLVGGGNEEGALRAAVSAGGLEQYVRFAGRVAHDEVLDYYDAIDIVVYPRLPIRLTELVTPLKPLEAMALGKALIASDVGGHRELIEDGVTGVLFRAGDAVALAAAVRRVVADKALTDRLRTQGPAFVRRERTWRNVVPRYRSIYERVMAAARR